MFATRSHTRKVILVFLLHLCAVTLGSWVLLAFSAHAQPAEAAASAETATATDADSESTPMPPPGAPRSGVSVADDESPVLVVRGDVAPFTGLLLRDTRFAALKAVELRVNDAEYRAKQEKRTREDMEKVMNACLRTESSGGGGFFDSFWGGMAIGVGAAILVGWLGYEILDRDGG